MLLTRVNNMYHCIFCNSELLKQSNEHIIQKSLGGTLSSNKIICGKCNNTFASLYDSEINNFYEMLIIFIAPNLHGRISEKKISIEIDGRNYFISPGSIIEQTKPILRTDKYIYSNSLTKITELSKNLKSTNSNIEHILLHEELFNGDYPIKRKVRISTELLYASLINLIEFTEYYHRETNKSPSVFSLKRFNTLIQKLQSGNLDYIYLDLGRYLPFSHDIDFLKSFFDDELSDFFCHRLFINYDKKESILIMSIQYLNTFPWVYFFENVDLDNSFSISYSKDLFGSSNKTDFYKSSRLTDFKPQYNLFNIDTQQSLLFAYQKLMNNIEETMNKIVYEYEMRYSDDFLKRIDEIIKVKETDTETAICMMINLRYKSLDMKTITDISTKNEIKKVIQTKGTIAAYRKLFTIIKEKYGFPTYHKLFGSINEKL